MDAHAGRVTRVHDDIELFVEGSSSGAAVRALSQAGFIPFDAEHPDEGRPFVRDGIECGLWFLDLDSEGARIPGRWQWELPPAVDEPRRQLGGVDVPVVSVRTLLELKTGFSRHPHGAPRRPKDVADIALLQELADCRGPAVP